MRHPFTTPLKGLDGFFDDPRRGEEFQAILRSFQRQIEEGFTRVSSAANIALALPENFSGQEDMETSLQEFLVSLETQGATQLIPKGVIVAFKGTWDEAEALLGWDICDGRGDTPNILGRYVKWVADQQDATGTGGLAEHAHDAHLVAQVAGAIADHPAHFHDIGKVKNVVTGNVISLSDHLYQSGATDIDNAAEHHHALVNQETDNAAAMAHAGEADQDLEHSLESNDPPYTTLIPIMKT